MTCALAYLLACSGWNRFCAQLGRLKKPQYLIGAIFGLAYFGVFLIRPWLDTRPAGESAASFISPQFLATYAAPGLLVAVFLAWLLPSKRTRLDFTETEIAFLFPAPLTRRTLINYRLSKTLLALAFTSFIMALLTWRMAGDGGFWRLVIGWWVIMSALELHRLGAGFTRTRLLNRGVANWQRRLVVLAIGAVVGWFVWRQIIAARALLPGDALANPVELARFVQDLAEHGMLAAVLAPFRWLITPLAATDNPGFALALLPALGLLAGAYGWILVSAVAFEEDAVNRAAQREQAIAAARAGNWHLVGARNRAGKALFNLRPHGPRLLALFWKNLIAAQSMASPQFAIVIGVVAVSSVIGFVAAGMVSDSARMAGFAVLPLIPMLTLVAPDLLRFDLRQDLPMADLLKTWPLRGWQLVFGEVLAPAVLVTCLQCALTVVAIALLPDVPPKGLPLTARLVVGGSVLLLLPGINFAVVLLHNATAILFPAWVKLGPDGAQGFEAMGQRTLMMMAQLLALVIALVPAVGLGALVFFVGRLAAGWLVVLPLAALAVVVVVALESALGVKLLGDQFERMDITD